MRQSLVEKTRGLILRVLPLTETSLIVDWLTPDFGRISTAAKGARRVKSPFRGKLDLFYLADFSFARSARSDLHTLREVALRETHPSLRTNMQALQQAAYCTRLLIQATERDTPLPGLFDLLLGTIQQIASQPPKAETVLAFEVKLLTELGLAPDVAPGVMPNPRFLEKFILYHLGKIPSGRAEAIEIKE